MKVFCIERQDIKAKMQGCSAYHKILEGNDIAFGSLLALDASGKLRYFQRDGMHDHFFEDTFGENAPTHAVCIGSRPVDTVRKLHNTDSGDSYINLAMNQACLIENIFNAETAPFACNQNTCIKDQAQVINPMKYLWACGCG